MLPGGQKRQEATSPRGRHHGRAGFPVRRRYRGEGKRQASGRFRDAQVFQRRTARLSESRPRLAQSLVRERPERNPSRRDGFGKNHSSDRPVRLSDGKTGGWTVHGNGAVVDTRQLESRIRAFCTRASRRCVLRQY